MKAENLPRADFLTSIVLVAFGTAVFINSMQMPTFAERGVNPYSAPGIVPGVLGAVISILGAVLFVRSLIRGGFRLGINGATVGAYFRSPDSLRLLLTIVLSTVYALVLLGRVAYELATALYVLAFDLVFDLDFEVPVLRQWKKIIWGVVLGVLTSAAVTAVFRYLFLVSLPG